MTDFRETERAVFDIAVGSLNFASGFLSTEDVDHLRRYAEYLGVDPMDATPADLTCIYDPPHMWGEWQPLSYAYTDKRFTRHCEKCGSFEYRTRPRSP
jgi:hypothetical protein